MQQLETYVEKKAVKKPTTQSDKFTISFNKKLKRLNFLKPTINLLEKTFGQFEYVLFKFNPKVKNSFWVSPCNPHEIGAKKLNKTFIVISKGLSEKIGLDNIEDKTGKLPLTWDYRYQAAKINIDSNKKRRRYLN